MTKSKGHMIMLGGNMERREPQALLEVDDELLNKGLALHKKITRRAHDRHVP